VTRLTTAAVALCLGLLAAPTTAAKTDCNRACLTGFADTFLKALAANTPNVVPLAPNAKVTFNGRAVPLAQAF